MTQKELNIVAAQQRIFKRFRRKLKRAGKALRRGLWLNGRLIGMRPFRPEAGGKMRMEFFLRSV